MTRPRTPRWRVANPEAPVRLAVTTTIAAALACAAVPAIAGPWVDPPARHGRTAMAQPAPDADDPAPDDDDMAQAEASAKAGSEDRKAGEAGTVPAR